MKLPAASYKLFNRNPPKFSFIRQDFYEVTPVVAGYLKEGG